MKNELGEISSAIITLKPHDHLCLIYESREEQYAAVIPYIKTGLERNEKCLYIIDESSFEDVRSALQAAGVEVDQALRRGALLILTKQDTYLKDGAFNPDRMMAVLEKMVKDALAEGFNALRVTGEMTWVLGEKSSVDILMQYESMVNNFYANHQALAICQYNRQRFAAEIILDVIRTHPLVIYGSEVLRNDFFISPAYFGKKRQTEREVQLFLTTLQSLKKRQSELQEKEELLRQKESLLKTVRGERQSLQDRLNAITAYAYNMEYLLAQDGSLLYVTPSCERITGYTPEEFMANPGLIDEIVDPQDQTLFNAHQAEFLGRKDLTAGHEVNFRILHKDGQVRWLHHVCQTVRDEDGKVIGTRVSNTDITSFKQAEETARESEARFHNLIENAPQGIFIQTHHQFAYVNPTAVQLFGAKSAEDLIGLPVIERFHPRVRDIVRERIQQLNVQKHEVPTIEETYLKMDGSEFEVEVSAVPIQWHGSDGALVFFRDITDRKLLALEQKKFFLLAESSSEFISMCDLEMNPIYVNPAGCRIVGLPDMAAACRVKVEEYFFPEDQGFMRDEFFPKVLREGQGEVEIRLRHFETGEAIWMFYYLYVVDDDRGQAIGWATVSHDITERKRAEEALRASEELFRTLVTSMNDVIYTLDVDQRHTGVYGDWVERAGLTPEFFLGKTTRDIFGAEAAAVHEEANTKALAGEATVYEWSLPSAAGIQHYQTAVSPLRNTSGEIVGVVGVGRDISELKEAEEEIQRNETRLKSLIRILQHQTTNIQEFLDYALDEAIQLTESEIGYIYFYSEEKKEFTLNTWSRGVMEQCSVNNPQTVYELEKTGIWGEAVRQRQAIMVNDFEAPHALKKGYPKGHAPLHKFLTIPVFSGGQIVAVVGVANKKTDYDNNDVLHLQLLMDGVWKEVDRKKNLETLKESEERFRVAQEISPDGFTILHPVKNEKGEVFDFCWVYENEAIARINGTNPKDVIGKRLLELFPSHQGTAVFEAYIQAAVTGNTQIIEEVYVGEIISKPTWLRLVIVPMGEDVAVLAQDISEHKRLREEIQESEEKYKALFEQSGEGIHLHTLDGRIVDVNQTACTQSGYLKEELLNLSIFDLHPKKSQKNLPIEEIMRQWEQWQAGETYVFEVEHQRKDGTVFPVEISATVITIKDQKLILAMVKDITERKRAEEALRKSESMFKKVFEILPIGLWIADKNGKLMQGNPAGVKIWGEEPKLPQSEYGLFKARRLPSGEEIAPDDWALAHTVNEGVTVVDELLEIEAFDGKKKIILNYTAPLLDSNGEVEGAIVVNQDITERMKAELDLMESEERFRQVFESANVGKSITLPAGEISVNRAFAQMLGYKQEELRHKKWQELTPAEEIEPIKAMLEPLLRGGKDSARFSKRYIRKDGSTIWADVSTAILRDAQGRPKYFITTVVDITEAKRSREAESKLAQRIEAGLRAGNLAWWEMELPSGKVAFDNRKAEMLGYPPKKFKTYEDFTRLLHAEDHPKAMQAMRDHLEGRAEVYDVEYRIKTKSGAYKWLHDIGATTERDPQSGMIRMIGIVDDISQRKAAELELEAYSNQLEELVAERTRALEEAQREIIAQEKLATLGQLAGGVGHELRNPLSVISNAIYLLKATVAKENDKAREYAEMIAQQVQRSNKIISDLLDFARESTGASPANVDVREVVGWVLQHFAPPEGVSVRTTFAKDLPTARADRQHMEQILANLVKNACQAMPEGGMLSVSAQGKAGEVQIAVRDNGAGISAANREKLFTPLFTTRATGIGLGLATSKKLAEANSGRIEVKSKEGEGSTFTLVLPAAGGSNDA